MSVIPIEVKTPYAFYSKWLEEVIPMINELVQSEDAKYLIFIDEEGTFVYFPDIHVTSSLPDGLNQLTPVYCSHCDNLSEVTFEEFTGICNLPYSKSLLNDIVIQDLISPQIMVTSNIKDTQTKVCLKFAIKNNFQNKKLIAYIKQLLLTNSEEFNWGEIGHDVEAEKFTQLELESELKRCNPKMYMDYKSIKCDQLLLSISTESRNVHEMEHKICGLVHEVLSTCVVNCQGEIWCFIENIWKETSSDGYLWNFLTKEFIEYLNTHDGDQIALYIMSITTRSKLLKDIKLRLQDDNFGNLLDSKRNLINMKNGVYNTDTEELDIPVASDFVSITAGVPYEIFDHQSIKLNQLVRILRTIFPEEELLEFFVTSCATFLEGYNTPKVFYIWWGTGNNAKSLIQTLVMKTFGEYCSSAPTSLVTGKRGDSSGATPELCHVEKRLVVFLQEPNPEEKIKAGKMKEMTGNDTMYVRQLFKSGKTMNIKSKFVIVCNNIIEIPGMDAAIRRRVVVIPFISTFMDISEYNKRQQKGTLEKYSQIIDPSVEKDLLSCKSAFMYLLCRRYSEIKNKALTFPSIIQETTEHYITKNNYPLKFIKHYVRHVDGSSIQITEIYEFYKDWFRRSYPGKKVQDFEVFVKEMNDEGYKEDDEGIIPNVFVTYSGEL